MSERKREEKIIYIIYSIMNNFKNSNMIDKKRYNYELLS